MNTFFAGFMYRILTLLMSLSVLLGGSITPAVDDRIASEDSDRVKMTAVLWGDSQVSDYMLSRQKNLLASCMDVQNSDEDIDALVIAGDIAENGKAAEYKLVLDDLLQIENVDKFIMATGNHDIRLRSYSQTVDTFSEFVNALNPEITLDRLYYSVDVCGYKFIVLGSVSTEFEEASFDEEEFAWLEMELQKATFGNKPVFVILHQPLKLTHNLPDAWNSPFDFAGSVGEQSDEITEILNKYKNVFLITGHLHSGLGEANFEKVGNFISVNLPSIGIVSKDGGLEAAGTGYMLEVYREKVVFRGRDFANGKYLSAYDMEFYIE